jgi:hypothetical protein
MHCVPAIQRTAAHGLNPLLGLPVGSAGPQVAFVTVVVSQALTVAGGRGYLPPQAGCCVAVDNTHPPQSTWLYAVIVAAYIVVIPPAL